MRLNPVELLLVNNPVRDLLLGQTMSWLHDAACAPSLGSVLEVGCGQGSGVQAITDQFRPRAIDAFDVDPAQVARADARRGNLAGKGTTLRLWVGDAERIPVADGSYDAVFELAVLHHLPDWRAALAEIERVLRPGGLFLFEELSLEFFTDIPIVSTLIRRFTDHPWSTMFDFADLRAALDRTGLRITALRSHILPGWHRGVAVRA